MLPPRLLDELRYIVGPRAVSTAAEDILAYESDAFTGFRAPAPAVVLPETREQVAAVVRALHRERVPYLARGAATGLAGGVCPEGDAVVISLMRLNRISAINPADGYAIVEPGVVNIALTRAAEKFGLLFAPDPGSQQSCTIGGNVACNCGGPHTLKYGVTTNHVLGLEVVLPGGEVVVMGGPAEDAPGLDLRGLTVGAEGTLGIVIRAWVRLIRAPAAFRTLLASFPTLASASRAVSDVIAAGIVPAAMEMMDSTITAAVEKAFSLGLPLDAGAILIIELDGVPEGLSRAADRVSILCRRAGATGIRTARTNAERMAIWAGRRKAVAAIGRLAPAFLALDVVVPRSRLPEFTVAVKELEAKHGLVVAYLFHAGDGNAHPNILYDYREPGYSGRIEKLSADIVRVAIDLGGSVSGEHGIGLEKREHLYRQYGPDELAVMHGIKDVFDSEERCNPGKVLPPPPSGTPPPSQGGEGPAVRAADSVLTPSLKAAREVVREAASAGHTLLISGGRCFLGPAGRAKEAGVAKGDGRWRTSASVASATPDAVVSTAGLTDMVFYEPEEMVVRVGAGMTLDVLRRLLAERGQEVPWDYQRPDRQTVGGIVASGVAGPRRLLFGAPRDHVLGVTAILSNGTVIRPGGRVVKNMAGYDLTRLLVGSRGTLGLIAEVTLKVKPLPEDSWMVTVEYGSVPGMAAAVGAVLAHGAPPSFLEIRGKWGAYVLAAGCEGLREQVAVQRESILSALGEGHNATERVAASIEPFLEEWTRHPWESPGPVLRVSVPRSGLSAVLEAVEGPVSASAGSGVVRVAPGRDLAPAELKDLMARLHRLAAGAGGWAVLERGPGSGLGQSGTGSLGNITEGVKRLFDPAGCFRTLGGWS